MTSSPDSELAWIERTCVLQAGTPPWDALAELTHVHALPLCRLLRSSPVPDGVALVHRVPASSVSLAELRGDGPLRAGHVITVALAVADALVALHDAGLAHGGISADEVLIAPDGSVHLTGCGAAWARPPGDPRGPRPSDDIADVGDLVRDALGAGTGHSALVLVALRAGDPDALLRPDAVDLRAALLRAGRPDPLVELLWRRRPSPAPPRDGRGIVGSRHLPPAPALEEGRGATGPEARDPRQGDEPAADTRSADLRTLGRRRTHGRTPRDGRRGAAIAGATGLLAVAVVLLGALRSQPGALAADGSGLPSPTLTAVLGVSSPGVAEPSLTSSSGAPAAAPPAASAAAPPAASAGGAPPVLLDRGDLAPDWRAVLADLDEGRRTAIALGSTDALARWVDRDGTAWAGDSALASRVRKLGATLDGGGLELLEVRAESVSEAAAVLVVRDRRAAYTVTLPGSTRPVVVPARSARWWRVTLRRVEDQWRVRGVTGVGAPTGVVSTPSAGPTSRSP
jgi:hypothetical protein